MKIIPTLSICTLALVALAPALGQAATYDQRIVSTVWNDHGPEGRDLEIKNIDLMEIHFTNEGFSSTFRELNVYLWVRDEIPSGWDSANQTDIAMSALRLVDKNYPDKLHAGSVREVGLDGPTGYHVFLLNLPAEDQPTCLDLYAVLRTTWLNYVRTSYSNQNHPNSFFHYCY